MEAAIHKDRAIYLNQAKYNMELLFTFQLSEAKSSSTLVILGSILNKNLRELLEDMTLYRQMVGCLHYLTMTCLNICYVIHQLAQFLQAPRMSHFQAVKKILRFIKGTFCKGLIFKKFNNSIANSLIPFSDFEWAGDPIDRRSTTSACIFLGGNLITWMSKNQPTVQWCCYILRNLGVKILGTPTVKGDKQIDFIWLLIPSLKQDCII